MVNFVKANGLNMDFESKNLLIIASLIKENHMNILGTVEEILLKCPHSQAVKFVNFSNKLTKSELYQFEKNIEEGCGNNYEQAFRK